MLKKRMCLMIEEKERRVYGCEEGKMQGTYLKKIYYFLES